MLLVALLLLGILAATGRIPGIALARLIAEKIVCAVELDEGCDPGLDSAYDAELASLARAHAPEILYERGMLALPVDYRSCREDACSFGPAAGSVWRSLAGQPATAFVHVIDCRYQALARSERLGLDCSGTRRGNLYMQYWFYYPGSATGEGRVLNGAIRRVSTALGRPSYHPDDWESYQVRIREGRVEARASSHLSNGAWGEVGALYVSGGSHAGRNGTGQTAWRVTPSGRLTLVPLEPIAASSRTSFAVAPPWLKRVWRDPESGSTE